MNNVTLNRVRNTVEELLPDASVRETCLEMFAESLVESNRYGGDKWGVSYAKEAIRHLVGSIIVFTIHRDSVWLALDSSLLDQSPNEHTLLQQSGSWSWENHDYPKYSRVPSQNGYYTPSWDHDAVWPVIRKHHFAFIKHVAQKFKQLRRDSQRHHSHEVLHYLRQVLQKPIPTPAFAHANTEEAQQEVDASVKSRMYTPIEPFSIDQYKAALHHIEATVSTVHRRILQVQYEAPERSITAAELASALGYQQYSSANLQYGRLARMLATALNCTSPPRDNGIARWWPVLSAGLPGTAAHDFQWVMHPALAQALEEVGWVPMPDGTLPEEVMPSAARTLREGSVQSVLVNAYERNPEARRRCITYYGADCYVCGFDFEAHYGTVGRGFIHVHHERPLATIGEEYEVNPITDLKPVCPNCHAMIHRRTPAYTMDEVRVMLRNHGAASSIT